MLDPLEAASPALLPAALGFSSENAAHRIAVEWEHEGKLHQGVYVPRRDTSSRFNVLLGGRLFPGMHHHAKFEVVERADAYRLALRSDDGQTRLSVRARLAPTLPAGSVFRSLREASEFFREGSVGFSPGLAAGHFDGLELRTLDWSMQPLAVEAVESSFFNDPQRFSAGLSGIRLCPADAASAARVVSEAVALLRAGGGVAGTLRVPSCRSD